MKKIIFLVLAGLFLQGCSIADLSSGGPRASVEKISPDTMKVTFCGNAFMNREDVEKYALQRASTEALSKGCPYFLVVDRDDRSKFCALGSQPENIQGQHKYPDLDPARNPNQSAFEEPNLTLTIRCIRKGESVPAEAVNAQEYLDKNFPGLKDRQAH